ncbi:MAG TPA: gephyrin-like molybdotransferase Glp [bacterium]|nr:gephyrin-like molybdotransferase Glp [bacterium]
MPGFTTLVTPQEAKERFARAYTPRPRGIEHVPLAEAYGRVLARDAIAGEDLPAFDRSTVDGFAAQADDVSSAGPDAPAVLRLAGEVQMGETAPVAVGTGETVRIPTGGMLPPGADAVVMLEDVEERDGRIAVRRPARPGDNVIRRAEDVRRGDVALRPGTRLRPQDIGLLAAIGITDVPVFVRPRVAIIATGDEIVPADRTPEGGQVRDVNTYALAALVRQEGGVAHLAGIVEDVYDVLLRALRDARADSDLVLVSGGSSVGERDAVARAIGELGRPGVIVHGVSIKPGKPTILALVDGTPVIGLPGHPVSGMVIFDVFVRDVLRGLAGRNAARPFGRVVRARLARPIPSAGVREDHIRVYLEQRDGGVQAIPVLGKSGIITTMTRADGIVVVPIGRRLLEAGADVDVELFEP